MKSAAAKIVFTVWAITNWSSLALAASAQLSHWKDELFAYPPVIERSKDGSYIRVAYDKQRDIFQRDKIPRRRAKQKYVNERVSWYRSRKSYKSGGKTVRYFAVRKGRAAPKITVIYLYGRGGNRRQGVNDWTFGGNFNRLQNLMVRSSGLLLTPDYSGFNDAGAADIAALMREVRQHAPQTFLVVACGSMGGHVCWRLSNNPATAAEIDGMFHLGSMWNDAFLSAPVVQKSGSSFPIFFGHGSSDSVFDAEKQLSFFRSIRKKAPNYPARFVMFDNGVHGTPIRMVDWRRELNWMLSIGR